MEDERIARLYNRYSGFVAMETEPAAAAAAASKEADNV
jgi:hypothetical protein